MIALRLLPRIGKTSHIGVNTERPGSDNEVEGKREGVRAWAGKPVGCVNS